MKGKASGRKKKDFFDIIFLIYLNSIILAAKIVFVLAGTDIKKQLEVQMESLNELNSENCVYIRYPFLFAATTDKIK